MQVPRAWVFGALKVLVCLTLILLAAQVLEGTRRQNSPANGGLQSKTFLSPALTLGPGDVINDFFRMDSMPKGHIALRKFDVQMVDSKGNPLPLSETYLHHWTLMRFYAPKGATGLDSVVSARNDGVCQTRVMEQIYGLGSETRHTNTTVPPPYGIVVGDPEKVPDGYEETWYLNLHTIDTRGTVSRRLCTECLCDAYNVTVDSSGRQVPPTYLGGLLCCENQARCALKEGYAGERREVFMELTVSWVPASKEVIPVKVYIMDVTDTRTTVDEEAACKIEYDVPRCTKDSENCIHLAESVAYLPEGGYVIYGDAHQHASGLGVDLYKENGELICSSKPIYGEGAEFEVGNEAGYIVGMSTCYPEPGTLFVEAGEKLLMKSWYNNKEQHTGAMGLFYLLVASDTPQGASHYVEKFTPGVLIVGVAITLIGVALARYVACNWMQDKRAYISISAPTEC